MNILALHNTFLPDYTGSSIRLYNLLSRIPYPILVITPDNMVNGTLFKLKNEKISNLKIKRISIKSPNKINRLPVLRYFYHEKQIFNASKKESFDLIHSRTLPPYIISAYKLHKKLNKPFLLEVHPHEDVNEFYMYYIINILKILKNASHTITLTNKLKEWVQDKYQIADEKISVIPNGVNSEIFKPQKSNQFESLREIIGNPEKIVLYAGYLDDLNGMDMVIRTIPYFVENYPGISFVFIGQGPYYNDIHKLSKKYNQIHLLSSVKHELMPYYYQSSDLFIIPRPSTISSELITPLKLLEALSMESVVLGSDVGGITEVIKNGENGYTYKRNNLNSFKNTLITSLEKDNTKITKNARETILQEYDWEKSACKLKKIYENLLN